MTMKHSLDMHLTMIYTDCYIWPEYMPFDTFNYLDKIPIPRR